MNSELTINLWWQISLNHLEALERLEEAMTTLIMKVSMCELYARIYEGATESISNSEAFRSTLFLALPEFHASVIVFSIKTREYFRATCQLIIPIRIRKPLLIRNEFY